MTDSIDKISYNRASRLGIPEQAGSIAQEVRRYRQQLTHGVHIQMSPLAQRVEMLDRLAAMGRAFLARRKTM